jgi:DNA-directed RNA polymerase specialized sigma24 family protein
LLNGRSEGPEQPAVQWVAAVRTIGAVKDLRVQQAMILSAAGKPQAEIAVYLGVTAKAVERMLANERNRLRRREAG